MHQIELVITVLVNNIPGFIAAYMAFLAWKKSQSTGVAVKDLHTQINGNRHEDLKMAKELGLATGFKAGEDAERAGAPEAAKDAALGIIDVARREAIAVKTAAKAEADLILETARKTAEAVEVRRADEHA